MELIIVCKPPKLWVHVVEHIWSSPHVITHDLVNLTIFCYDYKRCLSTILTFEQSLLQYIICKIIVQIGQYVSVFYFRLYCGSNFGHTCVNINV